MLYIYIFVFLLVLCSGASATCTGSTPLDTVCQTDISPGIVAVICIAIVVVFVMCIALVGYIRHRRTRQDTLSSLPTHVSPPAVVALPTSIHSNDGPLDMKSQSPVALGQIAQARTWTQEYYASALPYGSPTGINQPRATPLPMEPPPPAYVRADDAT